MNDSCAGRPAVNRPVVMIRDNLSDIPRFPLPDGYVIRSYRPGDEKTWVKLQTVSDRYNRITPELFRREFGGDRELLRQRQFYLVDPSGCTLGTATAWFNDDFRGRVFGRVHWVAVHPGSQGKGLSKPLLGKTCEALAALDHEKAYLVTSTARIPAISLYLSFGFLPDIEEPDDAAAWAEVKKHIPERFRR